MTQSKEARLREQITRQVGKRLLEGNWKWKGTQFMNRAFCGVNGASVYVQFVATFHTLKVKIESEEPYNIPDEEKVFEGETSAEEAVSWTADKLLEIYKTVSERTAPYVPGYEQYTNALRGRQ